MTNNSQKQAIEFTDDQFLALMKAVYLGNWVANAFSIKQMKEDYDGIEDYVFSQAPKFDLARYMSHEPGDEKRYYPTAAFEGETDTRELLDEYTENSIWDELAEWLGKRDFCERYSGAEITAMTQDERFNKIEDCIDLYHEEFEQHGIERLRIAEEPGD